MVTSVTPEDTPGGPEVISESLQQLRGDISELEVLEQELEIRELSLQLPKFVGATWPLVEPSIFIPNWHIDAICEHLAAITAGDIHDLLITMPPRHSKSLIVSVFWPVWEWITLPQNRWVFASYAFNLTVRDSVKRRKIFQSPWFQRRFYDKFTILQSQDTKIRYENDHHGFQLASSVGGSNTGEGGERIVADDPHNVKKAESEEVRTDTVDWWNIVMSTRRNSADSARVVVQQRTHEGDVAGDIIERGGYVHLNLPTEFGFGGSSACKTTWFVHRTGETHTWTDPRTEVGELLNPKRFNYRDNELAKLTLGDYQYAAQHGQNPTPPSGSIIQKEWLKYYGGPDGPAEPDWKSATNQMTPLLSLDASFKQHRDTDYVAGLGWAQFGANIYLMPQRIHARLNFPETINKIVEFVGGENLDKVKYVGIYPFIKLKLIEDKANGPAIVDTLKHQVPGLMTYEPGSASKESRLEACSWRFRAGNIWLPHPSIAPWITEYVYELCAFPKARKDDYVDATSQAILFIGGDGQVEGEIIGAPTKSVWINQLRGNDFDATEGSKWGNAFGGESKSIWR